MSGIDLSTRAGVLRFCELRRAEMVADFHRNGRFEMNGYAYGGYVFATHAIRLDEANTAVAVRPEVWGTGARYPHVKALALVLPTVVREVMQPEEITAFLGRSVKGFARATRARGVLLMTEAWRLKYEGKPPDRPYGWVEKDPAREECLMMSLEHADFGLHIWFATIHREPTRLGPWEKAPDDLKVGAAGRLTHLMSWMQ